MSHKYIDTCDCKRCAKEKARRAAQSAKDPRTARKMKLFIRVRKNSRHASKDEQHGRYLDAGPGAWDDR